MTQLERRLFAQSFVLGIICTLIVVTAQAIGLLSPLDDWLYDKRASYAQFDTPAPSDRIAHLDIDNAALEAIGRWPWPRSTQARILEEVNLTKPAAVGLDIIYAEGEPDGDPQLAAALRHSGVAVLASSFDILSAEQQLPDLAKAVDVLKANLELTPGELQKALGRPTKISDEQTFDALFLRARRTAMEERIQELMGRGYGDLKSLSKILLPKTDPTIDWPQTRLLKEQYLLAVAAHAVSRFGAPDRPMVPPVLKGSLSAVPLATFSDSVAGCGFANYDIFDNAALRSIPLIVDYQNRLYPQFGLAVACVAAGADPKQVRIENNNIVIPARSGTITIPTYIYHSRSLGKDVPLIAAVPWFGTRDWATMYDWPAHQDSVGHTSITKVWDLCLLQDIIAKNSAQIDAAIVALLANVAPTLGEHYAAAPPAPMDIEARESIAKRTVKELNDAQLIETYDSMPESEMKPEDREIRDNLHKALNDMNVGIANNRDARQQLDSQRRQLATALGNKAVFIGFTADGAEDKVNTSLHLNCPGVAVHGVIASDFLTGFWWKLAPTWIVLLLTLVLGIGTAAAQGALPPVKAGLVASGLIATYWIVNWAFLFAVERYLLGLAAPVIAIAIVWAVCTLQRVILEGVERIRIATENSIFQKEMSLARKVQFALVPQQAPDMPGINADGWTLPADMTGGDLFDLWKLPDGRLGILVADASGHGLAPAMIVSQVRTLVHMLSEYEPHPHNLLRRVNSRLALDLETGRFVTAFLAFIRADGEFEWASAGHGPMYWCPTGEGELIELNSSGLPLGVQEDWLADDPAPALKMELTGRLIVFSDGIFEAHALDPKAGLFGTDPIKEILQNACHASSSEIIHKMREAVQKFQGKKEPVDDQTIVVVRRVAPPDSKIDGDAVFSVTTDSPTTVVVPPSNEFEISVNNPALESPQSATPA